MRLIHAPYWPRLVILAVALLLYPLLAFWIWGGGWLGQRGFYDFGGGLAVHFAVGLVALTGAVIAGPRAGRQWWRAPLQTAQTAALGLGLTLLGLFGYDPLSAVSLLAERDLFGTLAVNLLASGLMAAFIAGGLMALRRGEWQTAFVLKGLFGGFAAAAAGAVWINPLGAAVIGFAAGFAVILASDLLEMLQIDDALGSFAVHGVGGAFGTLAVGLFLDGALTSGESGILMGGGTTVLGDQFIGLLLTGLCVGIVSSVVLLLIKATGYLRPVEKPLRPVLTEYDYEPSGD